MSLTKKYLLSVLSFVCVNLICLPFSATRLAAQDFTQLGSDIDGEAANDEFGYSVALSSDGTRLAIGAPYNDGNGNNAGQVRIYDWNGTNWTQVGNDIDGEAASDESGWSVALSSDGTRIAIGAIGNSGSGAGHVRVFRDPSITSSGGSGTVEPLPVMLSSQLIGLALLLFGVLTMIGQRILSNPNEGLTK